MTEEVRVLDTAKVIFQTSRQDVMANVWTSVTNTAWYARFQEEWNLLLDWAPLADNAAVAKTAAISAIAQVEAAQNQYDLAVAAYDNAIALGATGTAEQSAVNSASNALNSALANSTYVNYTNQNQIKVDYEEDVLKPNIAYKKTPEFTAYVMGTIVGDASAAAVTVSTLGAAVQSGRGTSEHNDKY